MGASVGGAAGAVVGLGASVAAAGAAVGLGASVAAAGAAVGLGASVAAAVGCAGGGAAVGWVAAPPPQALSARAASSRAVVRNLCRGEGTVHRIVGSFLPKNQEPRTENRGPETENIVKRRAVLSSRFSVLVLAPRHTPIS